MKHMPYFIFDYGNGLFPIVEQSVLYKETKCFSIVEQIVLSRRNKSFHTRETICSDGM